jgi:hypothetical protein
MPGRVLGAVGRISRRRLVPLVLAAVLAALLTALAGGAASADMWPSGQTGATIANHR